MTTNRLLPKILLGASVLLILLTLAAFHQVPNYDFVNYDDTTYLIQNPFLRYGLTWQGVRWAFSLPGLDRAEEYSPFWRPIAYLSHMLDTQLFGLHAGGHHVTSLIFHTANAALFFLVLAWMTRRSHLSFIAAAIFALHPLQAEPVVWISARNVVLEGFWGGLTLLLYCAYARKKSGKTYFAAVLSYALCLMSKATLVVLPLLLLCLDFWPLERAGLKRSEASKWKNLFSEKWAFFLLAAASAILSIVTRPVVLKVPVSGFFKLGSMIVSYGFYLGKTFFPVNLTLYQDWSPAEINAVTVFANFALILFLTGLAIRHREKYPYLLVGWLWYLIALSPASTLPQPATRYMYLAVIGLAVIVAWGSSELLSLHPYGKIALRAGSVLLLVIMLLLTLVQAATWRNGIALYRHVLDIYPDHYLAHVNLGNAYGRAGNLGEAISHFQQAIRIHPQKIPAYENLGHALILKGLPQEAEDAYKQILKIDPLASNAYAMLGKISRDQGQLQDAVSYYRQALVVNQNDWISHMHLAGIYETLGRNEEALQHYRLSLGLNMNNPEAHLRLARLLQRQGDKDRSFAHEQMAKELAPPETLNRLMQAMKEEAVPAPVTEGHEPTADRLIRQNRYEEALPHYQAALHENPSSDSLNYRLANTLIKLGRMPEALPYYQKALELNPRLMGAYVNSGNILIGLERYEEALTSYQKGLALDPDNWKIHENLAMVFRILGREQEAAQYSVQAAKLKEQDGTEEKQPSHAFTQGAL